jgi:rod shape-determining protein MreB and related proteins
MIFKRLRLGIDLGTANTLVFLPGFGIVVDEPTVVAISEQDNKILAVGLEAKEMIGKTPEHISAYRPMRDGVIADYRATEALLRYFIDKSLPKWNFLKPDVLISVPAGITSAERRAVIDAAIRAGAKNAYVMKEPILSAIGAGIPIYESNKGHVVVDIGGGTTDVAVISLGSIVHCASVKAAGDKIDLAIIEYMKKNYNLAIGERTAEDIKKNVASAVKIDEQLIMSVKGRDYQEGLPKSIEIKTNEITNAIEEVLEQMINAIKSVLAETPPELASDIMDHGIILTGGTSQLRNLTVLVESKTGVQTRLAENPLYCVSNGTGVALAHLDSYKKALGTKR